MNCASEVTAGGRTGTPAREDGAPVATERAAESGRDASTQKTSVVLRFLVSLVAALAGVALAAAPVSAQGSRKDDIVFGPSGHPIAGATITVCQATATGTPCSPLATIYTDATLTVASPNPFQTDGIGNYHFYAPAGRYLVQIAGPQITGTITEPDVILPADVSSSGAGNNISAFGLTLGGNLSVAGNATVTGTLSATNFNPGALTPSTLSVLGNETVAGPRPRVDVTAFGAKGDNATDDTAAIQAAITAACAGGVTGGGSLYIPTAGIGAAYKVTQAQGGAGSTAPTFTSCSGLAIEGAGNATTLQFMGGPTAKIVVNAGANPSAGPLFLVPSGGAGNSVSFKNLILVCQNQCINNMGSNVSLSNVGLTVTAMGSSYADNVALVQKGFWFTWRDGVDAGGILMPVDNSGYGAYHQTIENVTFNGGNPGAIGSGAITGAPVIVDIRQNFTSYAGVWSFLNDSVEDANSDFLQVENSTGNACTTALPAGLEDITIDHITYADGAGQTAMYTSGYGMAGCGSSGIVVLNSNGDNGNGGDAIRMTNGGLSGGFVIGPYGYATAVVDGNGNPVSGAITQTNSGFDSYTNTTVSDHLRTDISLANQSLQVRPGASAFSATASGNIFRSVSLDPVFGVMFSPGNMYGYTSSIGQTVAGDTDFYFASFIPPTSVSGTATTGGTLAAGSYWYAIRAALSTNCNAATQSAPAVFGPVAVSGANNAVQLNWTQLPGLTAIGNYCVQRFTSAPGNSLLASTPSGQISTASTSPSFLDTGSTGTGNTSTAIMTSSLVAAHRFTPTALGVNTTNPQFNLDVNGTAAVNSLNGVQKAERFSGSDAAVQINACLTAAATTSSVCDARGLTGTLISTHHITIPAGTTLEWGQAQLVISDSTTSDAVELTGDGASLVGYQESGLGTVAAPDTSGYIGCGIAGCTVVKKPNPTASKINFVHIFGMYLQSNGANSKVIDMTSIGHSDIENNNFQLGTGGNSYGVYGSSSVGGFDGSNTLFKHNNFQPETAGDTCFYLAGTFNAVVLEQNACVLPPGASTGYTFAKDSSGNYPNNDEIYGNDCETSSQAFNQICYNIVGATSITFGPNNRCENVYNCYQFPSDGSAVGIHVLDPYLSITNNTQIKPNEPATAMVALDNNGHNWTPSMHYGINDLAADNLLGNASFEGWQNTTTLYYWGGVAAGGTINQAGSGIYLQNGSSSATPAVDAYTQGAYNVRVGDGATAGLGINSGCIQVDATKEYTLMMRVASGSTSNNFRPGLRFYWDANCTTGDVISSVATNARVLSAANYAGNSTATGNWQSTNASLTYNNGITCGCNVTGADWQVSTAGAWTPTRNYGLIFRVPNGYSLGTTVAHSMRIFLLENTAAAGNYVYFDDVVLSQGPVTPDLRLAPLHDSQNPIVYGSLGVSQHLNQGAANTFAGTVALASGTATVTFPTAYNSAPVCTANDTSAIATVRVQTTATAVTLTQSSGTDTIMYICVGNPN
ncbi:MAG: glycosyl hydrolase family 28-related protein [Candidatus Acidiferrales bacterium]